MPKAISYTEEQLAFIEANSQLPRKELTARFNQIYQTSLVVDHIKNLCTRKKWKTGRTGCFDKGHVPANKGTKGLTSANKTSFKKGRTSFNQKPVGYEYTDAKDGYVHIKVAEPNIFKLKHRVVWEQHNGTIPEQYVVAFKNMDKTDCRIDNLILMTRAEMVRYNQRYIKHATSESNESCLLMAKVKNKAHSLMKSA